MDQKLKDLEKKIGKVPKIFQELKELSPEMYGMVEALDQMIWADGTLTRKDKKLIAIAVAAALRDRHAVKAQMAGASNLGVTKDEIEEALRVTFILAGMPAYMYGRTALDDLVNE